MKYKFYKDFNEHVYSKTLSNGLKVILVPKTNFYKTFVTFTTNYGSNDLSFIPRGKTNKVNQPPGIAHFLEHLLFNMPDGTDAFDKLSSMGVDANAFTGNNMTSYLFSGTLNIKEALTYLLDFVQTPYFTKDNVLKERDIIKEEINMYLDDPYSLIQAELSKNTFKNNPLKHEVIGTIDSIEQITVNDLYTAYNTFYHPSNMNLVVVGNFLVDEIIELVEENQNKKDFKLEPPIKRYYPYEPAKVYKQTGSNKVNITIPLAGLTVKLKKKGNLKEQFKNWYVKMMLLDYFFSNTGVVYEKLLNEEVINDSFNFSSPLLKEANILQFISYSNNPDKFIKILKTSLINLSRRKFSSKTFKRLKRSHYGKFIKSLNSIENLNNYYMSLLPFKIDVFSIPDLIKEITLNDLIKVTKEIKKEFITSFILYPKKSK